MLMIRQTSINHGNFNSNKRREHGLVLDVDELYEVSDSGVMATILLGNILREL
jgi:hypothetical protein